MATSLSTLANIKIMIIKIKGNWLDVCSWRATLVLFEVLGPLRGRYLYFFIFGGELTIGGYFGAGDTNTDGTQIFEKDLIPQ